MFYSILDWLSVHVVGLGWTESQSSPTVQKLCIQHQWLVLARSNSLVLDTNLLHCGTLANPPMPVLRITQLESGKTSQI